MRRRRDEVALSLLLSLLLLLLLYLGALRRWRRRWRWDIQRQEWVMRTDCNDGMAQWALEFAMQTKTQNRS